eukprot:snap_masked-scaffold_35-processed-gene-2.11-mRNA-1 protein AED:1.00 eAED:1.00 QI:0/-1/0/0/-1/1/1/0/90
MSLRKQVREELIKEEGRKFTIYNTAAVSPMFGVGHRIREDNPEYGFPDKTPVSEERGIRLSNRIWIEQQTKQESCTQSVLIIYHKLLKWF